MRPKAQFNRNKHHPATSNVQPQYLLINRIHRQNDDTSSLCVWKCVEHITQIHLIFAIACVAQRQWKRYILNRCSGYIFVMHSLVLRSLKALFASTQAAQVMMRLSVSALFRRFKIYVCMFFFCFVKAYILKISSISESDYLLRRYLQMHGVFHSFFSHFVLVFLPWFGSYGFVNSLTGTSLVSFCFILIQSSELFSCCQRAVAFILLTHHTVCPTYYAKVAEYGLHRSRCTIFFAQIRFTHTAHKIFHRIRDAIAYVNACLIKLKVQEENEQKKQGHLRNTVEWKRIWFSLFFALHHCQMQNLKPLA